MVFGRSSFPVHLSDILFAVLASHDMFDERIIPMSHAWYQLVPEVHILLDAVPNSSVPILQNNTHTNLTFHLSTDVSHYLIGTEFERPRNLVQSRHISGFARLYELYPNKSFYVICDDDTYLFPENLVTFLKTVHPSVPVAYGRPFLPPPFASPFYKCTGNQYPVFLHGGSGIVFSRGLMRVFGPRLIECRIVTETANFGSDERLGVCLGRLNLSQHPLVYEYAFNEGHFLETKDVKGGLISFHQMKGERIGCAFNASITVVNEEFYYDWSHLAFQLLSAPIFPSGLVMSIAFGNRMCYAEGPKQCLMATTPFEVLQGGRFDFRQTYQGGFVVYLRCAKKANLSGVAFGGMPPVPERGVVLELECPGRTPFIRRNEPGKAPVLFDMDDRDFL
jgi:hypothetical protein